MILCAGFFLPVYMSPPILQPLQGNGTPRIGFESRGLLMDIGEFTDIWTGNQGIDTGIISLVQEQLYVQALQQGVTVSEDAVESSISSYLSRKNLTNESWASILNNTGLTINDARYRTRKLLIANIYVQEMVTSSINVTQEEIQEFYDTNKHKFKPADSRLNRSAPRLEEVTNIINATIRKRKIKLEGQSFVDNLLLAAIQSSLIIPPSNDTSTIEDSNQTVRILNSTKQVLNYSRLVNSTINTSHAGEPE